MSNNTNREDMEKTESSELTELKSEIESLNGLLAESAGALYELSSKVILRFHHIVHHIHLYKVLISVEPVPCGKRTEQ